MRGAWVVAQMTFLEARRNRVTWSILFFCIISVLASFILQEVTIVAFDRLIRDVGIATIDAFGVLLAVFLGVSVLTREVDRRTVYNLLSKPVGRSSYLVGKLLGVWLTLAVSEGLMLVAFLAEVKLYGSPIPAVIFQCFWLMLLEFLVIVSFSLLASTFTSSVMSAFMSGALYFIGHLSSDIYFFGQKSASPLVKELAAATYFVLPDLERLNLKTQVSTLAAVPGAEVFKSSVYAMIYVVAFLALGLAIFSRRDLK